MLPPCDSSDFMPQSVQKSNIGKESNYDHSKYINDDKISLASLPMSTATRKSNLTMLSHQTFKYGM